MRWFSLDSPVVEFKYVFLRLKAENDLSPTALDAGMTSNSFPRVEISLNIVFCGRYEETARWLPNHRMFDRIESKIFLFLLFYNACRSDSKSPISPITVAGVVTYLATGIRRFVLLKSSFSSIALLLKSFLFLHCILPVRISILRKSWFCIR